MNQRVNYDKIAKIYDTGQHRGKQADPDFLTFLAERGDREANTLASLDIGCGTGNQLVTNRARVPAIQMVGLDLFGGMLHKAKKKAGRIDWLQADGARLPLKDKSFDFITNQFSFHHVQDKALMIAQVFRVLRPGSRFVMTNLCPQKTANWALYRYFPAVWEKDLQDFLPPEEIKTLMVQAGFDNLNLTLEHTAYEHDLQDFAAEVYLRAISQLITIPEADYQAGLRQIETELQRAKGQAISIPSEFCMLKISGEKIRV